MRSVALVQVAVMLVLCVPPAARASRGLCVVNNSSGPRGANAVFRGRVLSVQDRIIPARKVGGTTVGPWTVWIVRFAVEETFWGNPPAQAVVAADELSLDVRLTVGAEYLVYAESLVEMGSIAKDANYEIGDCNSTRPALGAERQMQALREYAAHAHSSALEWQFNLR